MADPNLPLAAGSPHPDAAPDRRVLDRELVDDNAERLARYARRARRVVRFAAVPIAATGVAGLLVGAAAWRGSTVSLLVVAALCLPAVIAPVYAVRRVGALAVAASQPHELVAQARDLLGRVRGSAELRALSDSVTDLRRSGATGTGPSGPVGRFRTLRQASQLVRRGSAVLETTRPDAEHEPLLVAFTPDRLRSMWTSIVVSLWSAPVAALVVAVSVVAVALRRL